MEEDITSYEGSFKSSRKKGENYTKFDFYSGNNENTKDPSPKEGIWRRPPHEENRSGGGLPKHYSSKYENDYEDSWNFKNNTWTTKGSPRSSEDSGFENAAYKVFSTDNEPQTISSVTSDTM